MYLDSHVWSIRYCLVISFPDFRSQGPWLASSYRQNSSRDSMEFQNTKPFATTLAASWYTILI